MTDAQIEGLKETAAFKFDGLADIVKLDDMPTNEEASERGVSEVIWMRACGVILQDTDEELFAKMKDDESADVFLTFVEDLAKFIDSQKAGLGILGAARARLIVCLSRYAEAMENGDAS